MLIYPFSCRQGHRKSRLADAILIQLVRNRVARPAKLDFMDWLARLPERVDWSPKTPWKRLRKTRVSCLREEDCDLPFWSVNQEIAVQSLLRQVDQESNFIIASCWRGPEPIVAPTVAKAVFQGIRDIYLPTIGARIFAFGARCGLSEYVNSHDAAARKMLAYFELDEGDELAPERLPLLADALNRLLDHVEQSSLHPKTVTEAMQAECLMQQASTSHTEGEFDHVRSTHH